MTAGEARFLDRAFDLLLLLAAVSDIPILKTFGRLFMESTS